MSDHMPVHNNTACSIAAAVSMRPCAATIRDRIHTAILAQGLRGCTAAELEHALAIPGNTVRPRLVELRDAHRITTMGELRFTASGRRAVVWISTQVVAHV